MKSLSHKPLAALGLALLALGLLLPGRALAQGIDMAHRPVADIRIEGLEQVPETLVRNQVRINRGEPYDPQVVQEDIVRITHLGRFASVQARVEPQDDGSVVLIYQVSEQALISDVQVVGNKAINDQELLGLIRLRSGDPIDPFLIDRATREIRRAYERRGYFVSEVTVDQEQLTESSILIFHVREGPRPRIRDIRVEGNTVFSDKELQSKVRSRTYLPILRKGELNREQLDNDAAQVRDHYRERGYLDAQVGRRIDVAPDQKSAAVVFQVEEGQRYTVASVQVEGNSVFSAEQIRETMVLREGDVYSAELLRKSQEALVDLYGKLGFIETRVTMDPLYHEAQPQVDVRVRIQEGSSYLVGRISVQGNQTTQDKVILRQVRGMNPGTRFDREGIARTEQRLRESAIFTEGKVTILGEPEDLYRDVLVEVKEGTTGSLSFGAGVSSDAGVIGAIDLVQRNFDIADLPESFGEFFTGRSFRGAGQYFALSLQPGDDVSRYAVTFREPYLLDSPYFLDTNAFFFRRVREDYDEQRVGGALGLGQRFGDVWSAQVTLRAEEITIEDVEKAAPVDVFDVKGSNALTSLGLSVTRSTVDSRIFPTRGSRTTVGIARAGALGGDFDFTKATVGFTKYWTVDEDYLRRRTVLSVQTEAGYIFEDDEAPVFERFYAGGHRSFRGFRFRGVGPRGIRADTGKRGNDPVGGDWLFLLSFEYNIPIYQEIIRWVVFTDTGTVQEDFGFSDYRFSIGTGIRIKIPFLGQAPFALDVAVPIVKEKEDEKRLLSFDLAIPF